MIDGEAVREIRTLAQDAQQAGPRVIEIGDETYSTTKLHRIREKEDEPAVLTVHSLQALVEYLEANRDELEPEELIVHVVSPIRVDVLSNLVGDQRQRFTYLRAETVDLLGGHGGFRTGQFFDLETFNVALQSLFANVGDRASVLKVVGNVKEEVVKTAADDGMTQQVTARSGVARVENVEVPNPVELAPYRTFREVDQPPAKFVLRLQTGPQAALFEGDGGAWKLDAVSRVKEWLSERLDESITLIA